VNGFMVGKDAEWSGIIPRWRKMVNAVANSVGKIRFCGGSFEQTLRDVWQGYDPRFILHAHGTGTR